MPVSRELMKTPAELLTLFLSSSKKSIMLSYFRWHATYERSKRFKTALSYEKRLYNIDRNFAVLPFDLPVLVTRMKLKLTF